MPPIDPDAPWWINALLILAALLIVSALPAWLTYRATRDKLAAVAQDTADVKEQVQNTHSTNLRHDLDALRSDVQTQGEAVHRVERHLEDMAESTRAIEHSLDRRYRIQAKDLEHAVEDSERAIQALTDEIPGQIRDALREHVAACPLRNPKETS